MCIFFSMAIDVYLVRLKEFWIWFYLIQRELIFSHLP